MFSWQFSNKKERSNSWYIWAIVIALALIIWWYLTTQYILSIVVILLVGVFFLIENNSPEIVNVTIDENGILISESFYDFPKIETFAVIYDRNVPLYLRVRFKSRGLKIIDIPFESKINTADLRAFLLQYIEEDPKTEMSTTDKLVNFLKL